MKTLKQKNKEKLQGNFFLKASKGFTLVEMITAVAIFSLVMVIGMGALLNVLHANKQTQAIQTAVNNLNLAMEMMSREIRTGYYYHCGSGDYTLTRDCLVGDSSIAFEPFDGDVFNPNDQVVFRFDNNGIYKSVDSGANFLSLTAEELILEDLYFVVTGSDINDLIQPKVLIVAKGYVGEKEKEKTYFNLQTTVTQRLIDY